MSKKSCLLLPFIITSCFNGGSIDGYSSSLGSSNEPLESCEPLETTGSFSSLDNDTSVSSFFFYTSSEEKNNSTYIEEWPSWAIQIDEKVRLLEEYRLQSSLNETYCFFTDPHCFFPTRDYTYDNDALNYYFEILKYAYNASKSDFIVCCGDLLNNGDTQDQARYKLNTFVSYMSEYFDNSYLLVGNHDTNYQGGTYLDFGDWQSCMFSQDELNNILFNGQKSYYRIDTSNSSYYCFDSGIDWTASQISDYQSEQLEWFAESLLTDSKPFKSIFIHIAVIGEDNTRTAMMSKIEGIIESFNKKESVNLFGRSLDYNDSIGTISFIQCGHQHIDFVGYAYNEVPIILTRTFGSPESSTQPTFDIVFVDYSNLKIELLRIGDGCDRTIGFAP